jgi:hypothetical protein
VQRGWSSEHKRVLGEDVENTGLLAFCGPFVTFEDEVVLPIPANLMTRMPAAPEYVLLTAEMRGDQVDAVTDLGSVALPKHMAASKGWKLVEKGYLKTKSFTRSGESALSGTRPRTPPLKERCIRPFSSALRKKRLWPLALMDCRTTGNARR